MNRLARNSIAAGMTTLLITTGMSFAANGATTTTSYAEAQFVAAYDTGLGAAVNPLGDALEDGGSNACEPAADDCPTEAFTSSPLEPLEDLTVPAGDELAGSELGAAGNYATADGGASRAASGAVTQDGIVQVGGGDGAADSTATLDLSGGALGDLGVTDALTNLTADIGAISSSAELESPTADPSRDYNIAGADLTLSVPALREVAAAVDEVGDPDLDDVTLDVDTLCEAGGGAISVLLGGLDLDGVDLGALGLDLDGLDLGLDGVLGLDDLTGDETVDLCDNAVVDALGDANPISAKITGLNAVPEGLSTFTNDNGVVFDFEAGEIRLDLAAVLQDLGTDINELPENTDLLAEVLPALALNVDDLIDNLNDNLIDDLRQNLDVEVTVGGADVPLEPLTDGVRTALLPNVQDALDDASGGYADNLADPLAEGLTTLTDGLADVVQLIVNVPDRYTPLQSGEGATLAAAGDVFSQTALEIRLLDGQGADILLANSLVGPNAANDDADADGDTNGTTAGDGNDNGDTNADGAAAATAGDGNTSAVSIADADSAADADASASLPSTGAPNLLPFFLLGIALLAFGMAVLLNERRRLGSIGPDALA